MSMVGFCFSQSVEINGKKIDVSNDDLVFQVKGLVCSFCAHGLQKGLSKLKFVDKTKYTKGVYTDIEYQFVLVGLKDGKKVNIEKAIDIISDAGYEVLKSYINPSGSKLITSEYEDIK